MRFLTVLGVCFYSLVVILTGLLMILFAFNVLQPEYVSNTLTLMIFSLNSRFIVGLSGLLLILISISFARVIILGRMKHERSIVFKTSTGEVNVALAAVEDLTRRTDWAIPEIKELRPQVMADKRGIIVDLKAVLKSETSIPEVTQRLQDKVRTKVGEVLGIEEQVIIKIHVVKILSDTHLPFGGYGRV